MVVIDGIVDVVPEFVLVLAPLKRGVAVVVVEEVVTLVREGGLVTGREDADVVARPALSVPGNLLPVVLAVVVVVVELGTKERAVVVGKPEEAIAVALAALAAVLRRFVEGPARAFVFAFAPVFMFVFIRVAPVVQTSSQVRDLRELLCGGCPKQLLRVSIAMTSEYYFIRDRVDNPRK